MKRNCSLDEISDGKLYTIGDMVKADCLDCKGCSKCCHDMGNSIVLDPYDVHLLKKGTGESFEQLISKELELSAVDGIILPNIKMSGEYNSCSFLNVQGRCDIHAFRPSICRLFPLGRIYENRTFKFFLQTNECVNKNRTKIKVEKWIDTDNLKRNQEFICKWHYFLKDIAENVSSDEELRTVNMFILNEFYGKDFADEFYNEFDVKLTKVINALQLNN